MGWCLWRTRVPGAEAPGYVCEAPFRGRRQPTPLSCKAWAPNRRLKPAKRIWMRPSGRMQVWRNPDGQDAQVRIRPSASGLSFRYNALFTFGAPGFQIYEDEHQIGAVRMQGTVVDATVKNNTMGYTAAAVVIDADRPEAHRKLPLDEPRTDQQSQPLLFQAGQPRHRIPRPGHARQQLHGRFHGLRSRRPRARSHVRPSCPEAPIATPPESRTKSTPHAIPAYRGTGTRPLPGAPHRGPLPRLVLRAQSAFGAAPCFARRSNYYRGMASRTATGQPGATR